MNLQSTLFPAPPTWESDLLRDLKPLISVPDQSAIHLAIMVEPYMERVEAGSKTTEIRWSMTRQAPYGRVAVGDIVLFKRSGGLLAGWAKVYAVHCARIDPPQARTLVFEHAAGLGVDDGFADIVEMKSYATLIWIERFQPFKAEAVSGITIGKRDQRGWVVLRGRR